MNGFFGKGTPLTRIQRQVLNLLFGNLLMFTPPVGRCSVLVCDGLFLCNYYSKEKEEYFWVFVLVKNFWKIFFWYRPVNQDRISLRIT